jgi:pyruvate dehydrogenase E1 component
MSAHTLADGSSLTAGERPVDWEALAGLERCVQWLSAWTIHHANHIRPNRDGLKVGGHQASSASLTTIMTNLYFNELGPADRVAVKPHASPVYHAIQYILGRQSREKLENFRALGGAQAYPSRTKDTPGVEFSTGSVGLGVGITAFAGLVQEYLRARGLHGTPGRMIAIAGDAELDEGNVYEALIESYKHEIRNVWWLVDYNRQSLDAVAGGRLFQRYADIFRAADWGVVIVKYGKRLEATFAEKGGEALRAWIDRCPNDLYAALTYEGGKAWREVLRKDLGSGAPILASLDRLDDETLAALMTDLGGHCQQSLTEAFAACRDERPRLLLCYTVKGHGLPFQGHKDNHAGLLNPQQMEAYRRSLGVEQGSEWEPLAPLDETRAARVRAFLAARTGATPHRMAERGARSFAVPSRNDFPLPRTETDSTQAGFGRILFELAKLGGALADRIVTTSPDVTVSTNIGGWVNRRGVFHRTARADVFAERNVPSAQRWSMLPTGQHIELGIAENNFFLLLGALGLSADLFGERLLPIGTLYDPFIARGLDALNYACYQNARFILVATPSGITLAPEGGAHQSIGTPLIGMSQDGLSYFEPAFVDELAVVLRWALEHIQAEDGGSVYLRLSTRPIAQPKRDLGDRLARDIIDGAYWAVEPHRDAKLALIYCGAIAPETITAHRIVAAETPGAGLLAVTSPDRLHSGWTKRKIAPKTDGQRVASHVEWLLDRLAPDARLVTVIDGAPSTLSWLGSVRGHRLIPLGVEQFGQSAAVPDLYALHGLDADRIAQASIEAFLPN